MTEDSRSGGNRTPIELLSHVPHMEQRWFVWGFLGEHVEAIWPTTGSR